MMIGARDLAFPKLNLLSWYLLNLGGVIGRCIDGHKDSHCGNETAFYPPLTRGVNARPAACVEHAFAGTGLNEGWTDTERRGAYVGGFAIR